MILDCFISSFYFGNKDNNYEVIFYNCINLESVFNENEFVFI